MTTGKVLVIDDSDDALRLMADILSEAGYEVFQLSTPIGATRTLVRNSIGAVVIDVRMPAMQGDKLAKMFRENPRFQKVAVVLVSGEQEDALQELGQQAGADGVVTKADMMHTLVDEVRRAIARKAVKED